MDTTVNIHLKRPASRNRITAKPVPDRVARFHRLMGIAGVGCLLLRDTIHANLARMCADHAGDEWDGFALSNGGFYIAPRAERILRITCDNGFQAEVDAATAGLIACAGAYSHLALQRDGRCYAEAYDLLSQFIFQHREAELIRAALH